MRMSSSEQCGELLSNEEALSSQSCRETLTASDRSPENLTIDSFHQYVIDSQNRVVRVLGSTYCSGLIEYKGMKFLIMDQPARANLPRFINELKNNCVKHVFRVCNANYPAEELQKDGIKAYDLPFDDGGYPDKEISEEWICLIKKIFTDQPGSTIAVHCVAGLGRAPVMVAIALMEAGMRSEDAVEFIRQQRRGAINNRQLEFLEHYKASRKLKFKHQSKMCVIC